MFICPKTGVACQCGCEKRSDLSGLVRSCSESEPNQSELNRTTPNDFQPFAKIQPEEVYRAQPMDFSFENAVQGLVSLYALAYGGAPAEEMGVSRFYCVSQFSDSEPKSNSEDLAFWTKVDEICDMGERLKAGEEISPKALPKITREDAKRMFHLVMEAQVAMLPPHLLPENQFKCTGCGG